MIFAVEMLLELLGKAAFLISGVDKGSLFPKPLNAQRESECIARKLQGSKEAAGELVEHNLRLLAHIAKKYRTGGRDIDDLVSIGTIGLIKAVNTYKPDKGVQLATYAARCVDNEILMYLRTERKKRNEVYMEDPIGVDGEGNEISLGDILGTGQDEVIDAVDLTMRTDKLRELIKHLPQRLRDVIEMRYGINGTRRFTQKEIADKLGISRSYVSRIESRAIDRLRHDFGDLQR